MSDLSQGSIAAATSMFAVAGIGETALEHLPKGALVMLTVLLFGVVLFFVKRDATRWASRFAALERACAKCGGRKRRRKPRRRK